LKNKPKSIPGGIQSKKQEGARNPTGKNDEPKTVFKISIEQFDNDTSRHIISAGIPLEAVRNTLFAHMMLIEEQITMIKIQQQQNKIKIATPSQLPPGMKLHS